MKISPVGARRASPQRVRKNIRLPHYDYSQNGWYFVTICTQNRDCIFGDIVNGDIVGVGRARPSPMELNEYGLIVQNVWKSLPNHHSVKLDAFQIMPNHVHFIICMTCPSRWNDTCGTWDDGMGDDAGVGMGEARLAPTTIISTTKLGTIIGSFKSEITKQIHKMGYKNDVWQRNYYERIIRNEEEYQHTRYYIKTNPKNWGEDRNNIINIP